MWQLYQFPLCPFSRKVRLLLGEKGVGYELVRESPWERRDEFIDLNPAGRTPVMVDQARGQVLAAAQSGIEHDQGRKRHIMLPHTLYDQFALILGNGPVGPLVALGPPELMTWIGKNDMIVQGSCKNAVDGHAVFIDIGLAFAGYLVEQQTNFGRCDLFDGKRTDPLA